MLPYTTEEATEHLRAFHRQGEKHDFGDLLDQELQMAADAFSGYEVPNNTSAKEQKAIADYESAGAAMFGLGSRATAAKHRKLGIFKRRLAG